MLPFVKANFYSVGSWVNILLCCLVLNFTMSLCIEVQSQNKIWTLIHANTTQILAGTHTETHMGSEIRCASKVAQKEGGKVYCYNDGRCIVFTGDLGALRGPATPGWSCKIEGYANCDLEYGSPWPALETRQDSVCSGTCTLTGIEGSPPPSGMTTPPITCCSAPFIWTSHGCLLYQQLPSMNWCDNRAYCLSMGGSILTADSKTHMEQLFTTIYQLYGVGKVWASVRDITGSWQWDEGQGRTVASDEWDVGTPTGAGDCAMISSAGLRPLWCTNLVIMPVCYAPVNEC